MSFFLKLLERLPDIEPPKKVSGDYSVIKKWNEFLFEATGKTTKERKKDFGKR